MLTVAISMQTTVFVASRGSVKLTTDRRQAAPYLFRQPLQLAAMDPQEHLSF